MLDWDVTARAETRDTSFELCRCNWPSPAESIRTEEASTLSVRMRVPARNLRQSDGRYEHAGGAGFLPLGPALFQPRETLLHARGEGGEQQFLRVSFLETARRETRLAPDHHDPLVQRKLMHVRIPSMRFAIARVISEVSAPGMAADFLLDGLSAYLRVELSRYLTEQAAADGPAQGGLAPWQIKRITERIHDDLAAPPTLTDLSRLVRLSPRHLSRAFKIATEQTLSETIELARQERAEQLLLAGRHPMKQIASQLGFSSQASFSTAFRRRAGCSPREFVKRTR